jgi:hypothetical protein
LGRFTASKFVSDRTRIRALNQLTDLVAGGMKFEGRAPTVLW